jgi:predicted nucleic acid-binding protein
VGSSLRLVLDASTLVGELLRARGRDILQHPAVELHIAETQWDEARHELARRLERIRERRDISPQEVRSLLERALDLAAAVIQRHPEPIYRHFELIARRRVPQDQDDWPVVALALAIDAGIWTRDTDFFGCGIATWSTEVLLAELGLHRPGGGSSFSP